MRDAFARSVLWGFTVAAESNGRVLVDATEWLLRDNLNLAPRLRPGSYKLDEKRSSVYRAGTFNFPKNTEIEVELTYVLQQPSGPPQGGAAPGPGADFGGGRYFEGVGDVAASAEAASLRVHHSFVELPDAGYRPRFDDPRAGYIAIGYQERSAPPRGAARAPPDPAPPAREDRPAGEAERGQEADRLLPRSRHARADPLRAPRGRALVEPGLRGRGLQGRLPRRAAAGRRAPARRALQRDQLGAPLDARLEHRRRGLRSAHRRDHQGRRHARLAARAPGLPDRRRAADAVRQGRREPAAARGVGARAAASSSPRTRSATRSGSRTTTTTATLGRISVMDYPHPLVTLKADGTLDASSVYARGIGEWDKVAIAWGYSGRSRRAPTRARRSPRSSTRPGSATCAS